MSLFAHIAHLLVPRESNNYKAKLLHPSTLCYILASFLVFQIGLSSVMVAKPDVLGFSSQISPEKIVELTNQERSKAGAPLLRMNSVLSESAQRKAGDMFAFNYWAHNSPSGRDPWSFFKEAGYRYLFAGENLARDFSSPEAVVAAWVASPSHRENLLNPKYQEIGVSVVDGTLGGTQTTLVVQHFGTVSSGVAQVSKERVPAKTIAKANTPTPQIPEKKVMKVITPTNTPAPTIVPLAVVTTIPPRSNVQILANTRGAGKPLVEPFALTQNASLVLLFILMGVIAFDGIFVYRRKIFRLSGRSFAHFLFLGGIFLIAILSTKGSIL